MVPFYRLPVLFTATVGEHVSSWPPPDQSAGHVRIKGRSRTSGSGSGGHPQDSAFAIGLLDHLQIKSNQIKFISAHAVVE